MSIKSKISYLIFKLIKKIIIKKYNNDKFEDQFVVFSNDLISSEIILNKYYEKNILLFLKNEIFNKYIDKNDICIDVGANIGNHSKFFSKYFLKVFSFEPNKKSYEFYVVKVMFYRQ